MRGIVEADEVHLGGKLSGGNDRSKRRSTVAALLRSFRGRSSRRGSKVKAIPTPRVITKLIDMFLRKSIDPRAVFMTDYFPGYNEVRDWITYLRSITLNSSGRDYTHEYS